MSDIVFRADVGMMYEWATFVAYRHPTQPGYVTSEQSGCSCNGWTERDDEFLQAAPSMTRAETRQRLLDFVNHYDYYVNAGHAIQLLETALNEAEGR